jgi:hypothetical protein
MHAGIKTPAATQSVQTLLSQSSVSRRRHRSSPWHQLRRLTFLLFPRRTPSTIDAALCQSITFTFVSSMVSYRRRSYFDRCRLPLLTLLLSRAKLAGATVAVELTAKAEIDHRHVVTCWCAVGPHA